MMRPWARSQRRVIACRRSRSARNSGIRGKAQPSLIGARPSLDELGALGKRPYALALTHEQASVAWSHYQLRRTALERTVTLRPTARALLARVERAVPRSLGQLGGRLYQMQHTHAVSVSTTEWRCIWAAYRARRGPVRA